MITASLLLNVLVLSPVCFGLSTNKRWAAASYGEATPARGILLSVYLAIAVASAVLLVASDPSAVAALLFIQVVYKVTTPVTVKSLSHPVVRSNLGIAAFHSATLVTIWPLVT